MNSGLIIILNEEVVVYMPVICRHYYLEAVGNHDTSPDNEKADVIYRSDVAVEPLFLVRNT
jgi:hypothetical protein